VIEPFRAAPLFASTVNVALPLPVPPLEVCIHASPVVAAQPHQEEEVTEKLPEAPEDDSVPLDAGDNE
jgi:hypothetical protein